MDIARVLSPLDWAALAFFAISWLAYEPLLKAFAGGRGAINTDMTIVRAAWMRTMAARDNKFMDGQLLGHTLNSASFFASSNLILIAAAAGVLFGGETTFRSASSLMVLKTSSRLLFEGQIALVVIALVRGLLSFIWSIRQMNYCLAVIGAAPETSDRDLQKAYGEAASRLLNPALSSFNAGVRAYYFALAAAAWLFGGATFIAATLAAVALLFFRQRHSRASRAVGDIRRLLESPAAQAARPDPAPGAPSSSASP
jgi:uncharacterized membrane protein